MKWIPVTERLPEDGQVCIICGRRGALSIARFNLIAGVAPIWTVIASGRQKTVVAWMPAPEPYKRKEE